VNKHVSPAGEWGDGGYHAMEIVKEIIKNGCHPGIPFVYSPYVLGNTPQETGNGSNSARTQQYPQDLQVGWSFI